MTVAMYCTMTGYRIHKQSSVLQSMPGYMTSGHAPVLQVLEITHSSSVSSDW